MEMSGALAKVLPQQYGENMGFLAHLSRQAHKVSLKYTHAPASVRPSSVRPSSVRPSSTIFKDLLL